MASRIPVQLIQFRKWRLRDWCGAEASGIAQLFTGLTEKVILKITQHVDLTIRSTATSSFASGQSPPTELIPAR